ncbi:tyrosine/serine protein phosphatase [Zymoseptoria brevis]|uniref:Tyrosine/serine protein phosphatase n=1 Tax=Zymoseptoria brevis TaxID=1047168 RepID=A0A0F4G8I6_9PEZI|nr:tyrosine/serine protein phosphatase [Zymoseptoria brevis]
MSPPTPEQSTSSFSRIANFRDVALSTSKTPSQARLKPGLLFRSAAPDDATPSDQRRLTDDFHIKTIIDLRTDSEHAALLAKEKKATSPPADVPDFDIPSDGPPSTPAPSPNAGQKIPSIKYVNVNFNGKTYSSAMFSRLSYYHRTKLIALYITGYRPQAISIIGKNVMSQRGLIGLAKDSLEHCRAEIAQVFDVLSHEGNWPVLVHCTQGKDRTGMVVLLVALLLDVGMEELKRDYLMSREGLQGDREERVKAVREMGLTDEFAGCEEGLVEEIVRELREKYGGVEKYLEGCGITREKQGTVKEILTA